MYLCASYTHVTSITTERQRLLRSRLLSLSALKGEVSRSKSDEGLTEGACSPQLRELPNGNVAWDLDTDQSFSVDSESAAMIAEFEMEAMLEIHDRSRVSGSIGKAYRWYAIYGCLNLSHAQVAIHDAVLRRSGFKDRLGLTLEYDVSELQKMAVSFADLPQEARTAWSHKATTNSSQADFFSVT